MTMESKWKNRGIVLAFALSVGALSWFAGGIRGIEVGKREALAANPPQLQQVGDGTLDANKIEADLFLKHQGFVVSQELVWRPAGDGVLIADTKGGGVCLQLDRNGADGLFCSGKVDQSPGAAQPDGAVIYNWLAAAKGESQDVAKVESRSDKYRAVQRELRQSLEALERAGR